MQRQPTSDPQDILDMPVHSDADVGGSHGGRAGWFRVACGFSALAAIGVSHQAIVSYPRSLAGPLVLGAIFLAKASCLALQQRRSAGLFLLLGYVISGVALNVLQGSVMPPSFLIIASVIALVLATRRGAITDSRHEVR